MSRTPKNSVKHIFRFLAHPHEKEGSNSLWQIQEKDEIFHISKVLRLQTRDRVQVFDGNGLVGEGEIIRLHSECIEVLCESNHFTPPSQAELIMCVGALKPQTMEELLPGLSEMGVNQVWFFLSGQTEKFRLNPSILKRLEKISIVSAKQCKRPYLTKVKFWEKLQDLESFFKDPGLAESTKYKCDRFLLSPNTSTSLWDTKVLGSSYPCYVLIGGEAGFSRDEEEFWEKLGFAKVMLSPYILRAQTAALISAGLLMSRR